MNLLADSFANRISDFEVAGRCVTLAERNELAVRSTGEGAGQSGLSREPDEDGDIFAALARQLIAELHSHLEVIPILLAADEDNRFDSSGTELFCELCGEWFVAASAGKIDELGIAGAALKVPCTLTADFSCFTTW